jgi:hypothetical protein
MDVIFDGKTISIPSECNSLGAIRPYLERLALAQDRVLSQCLVDGRPANSSSLGWANSSFHSIAAKTSQLNDLASEVLRTALQQTTEARALAETAVTLVLINEAPLSRELWCKLAARLKEPLLTLGLLPESHYRPPDGCVPFQQLRRWQIEHYVQIIEQVNEACALGEMCGLSNALEQRALPWLHKLQDTIELWYETALAGVRLGDETSAREVAGHVVTLHA